MTIPELPGVSYWRSPRPSNAGVLHGTRLDAVTNGEQVCEALYTADQMRAFGEACYLAGMERAADVVELNVIDGTVNGNRCIAYAIRAEAAKEAK